MRSSSTYSLIFAFLLQLLCGCSMVVNSHTQKEPLMTSYLSGNNEAARRILSEKLKEPKWYNSSTVGTADELVWRLESGSLAFHEGDFAKCIEELKRCEELISEYDERAKISVRDVGAEIGSAFTNLNALPYRGWCRDRMALAVFKSLAYLGSGNESSFRAQLKRLRNEQKKIQDDYRSFFEQEQQEIANARAQHSTAQSEFSLSELESGSGNREFSQALTTVRTTAHRGYGAFLNPAAIFLSGLGSLRDENFDNARIDFQRLCEAMPDNELFKRYLVTTLKLTGREIPPEYHKVEPFDFPLDRNCVFVISGLGRSGSLKQIAVYFPIITAWPMCEFYPQEFSSMQAVADGKTRNSAILSDMDGIIAQEFSERLPGIITRIAIGTAIKEAARVAAIAVAQNQDALTGALLVAGTTIYNTAMNTADTRSWEILPSQFQLTQFPMPENREVAIKLSGNSQVQLSAVIPPDAKSAIIYVSAPVHQNVTCHILPIKTK